MSAEKLLPPLKFDDRPRWGEFTVMCDLSETSLIEALRQLRPMVQARGYNSRPIELSDCILVGSELWLRTMMELSERFPGLKTQTVTPAILKGMGSWALVFGVDSWTSNPPW